MIDKKTILGFIDERIAELDNGLFVVNVSISKKNAILVELDKHEGGVSVKDCVSISRNIEHNLDREEQDFELNVTSAGIDRPLRVHAQFVKNVGREVELLMVDGTKNEGKLIEAKEKSLKLEISTLQKIEGKKKKELVVEEVEFDLAAIKETKIVISFK